MLNLYPWQNDTWSKLQGLRSRLPHALLLKGPSGVGKLDLAMQFSQSLLCRTPVDGREACGQCDACHWYAQGTHPDFRLIQPEALSLNDEISESGKKASQEISISQIRALEDFVNLSAHQGAYKIVVLHPAEAMNVNAANAVLKTLEEPTENLMFILVSHKPQQLLPTIISRCLSLAVPIPSAETSVSWLRQQGVMNPDVLLSQSGFLPLHAYAASEAGELVDMQRTLISAFSNPQRMDILSLAEQFQKTAPVQIIQFVQQWCHDLISIKMAAKARYFFSHADVLQKLAAHTSSQELLQYQKALQSAKREASHPLNPKLLFESLFSDYLRMFSK